MITTTPSKRVKKFVMHRINPKFVWQMFCGKSGQAIHGTSDWGKVTCISCLKLVELDTEEFPETRDDDDGEEVVDDEVS